MSTDGENIIPIGGRGIDSAFARKNHVLCMVDRARGVISMMSQMLMEQSDSGLQVDCSCALDLANEELQRVRDEVAELLHI